MTKPKPHKCKAQWNRHKWTEYYVCKRCEAIRNPNAKPLTKP